MGTGEERQGRSVSAQLLTKDGDQCYSWAESQLLTPVCLLNYCFSGYMAQANYRLLGVHRISLFRAKLFLCLCPAEYGVWYQFLALLLPQPGRCWDVHSTDILQTYDINWFQVMCTICFPSGTSKYAWSVSNNSTSLWTSYSVAELFWMVSSVCFCLWKAVQISVYKLCDTKVVLNHRNVPQSYCKFFSAACGKDRTATETNKMILKYQREVNSRTFKKVLLFRSLTGKRRDKVSNYGHKLYPQYAWHPILLMSQSVNKWVLYLLNRDRGKEPKLLKILYGQNLQVKLFEKLICHLEGIMIIYYEEQIGDKMFYAHQCCVHSASLWTTLAHQSVKLKHR